MREDDAQDDELATILDQSQEPAFGATEEVQRVHAHREEGEQHQPCWPWQPGGCSVAGAMLRWPASS